DGGLGMLRLVDDERAKRRQHAARRAPAHQQRMVHDHDLGRRRLASCAAKVAIAAHLADGRAAERGVGGDARSQRVPALVALPRELVEIAGSGGLRPVGEVALEHADLSALGLVARQAKAARAEIIRPSLEHHHVGRAIGETRDLRHVLAPELILQALRVRRDDDRLAMLARPQERRNQVGEALANTGGRLAEQGALAEERVVHIGGELALWLARLEAGERPRQGAARAEPGVDGMRGAHDPALVKRLVGSSSARAKASSSSTVTPSSFALSSFEPASSPATTKSVFLLTLADTFPPRA